VGEVVVSFLRDRKKGRINAKGTMDGRIGVAGTGKGVFSLPQNLGSAFTGWPRRRGPGVPPYCVVDQWWCLLFSLSRET
jgi:hypothetical protein